MPWAHSPKAFVFAAGVGVVGGLVGTLFQVGLTPRALRPSEYALVLSYGIGLTDLVKGQSGGDRDLDFSAADGASLRRKMLEFQPPYLCFNGKRSASEFLGRRRIAYGPQSETIGSTKLFVAPSTSGAANASWDVSIWQALAQAVGAGDDTG